MYSIWPYPPYFSPVAPTPGFSMMPTPYVVPLPTQYPAAIPTASGQGQHMRNSACGEPMLIQIGVQCVNQNNPVNINSLNDISSPLLKSTTNIVNNNSISEHQESSSSSSQSKSEENVSHGSLNSTFIEKCNSIESLIKETEKKLGWVCYFEVLFFDDFVNFSGTFLDDFLNFNIKVSVFRAIGDWWTFHFTPFWS